MSTRRPEQSGRFPAADAVRRILVLRTAQLREVEWAIGELCARYPAAQVGVLGTRLEALGVFGAYERFEVKGDLLTPAAARACMAALRRFHPDLAVMCLNNGWDAGYEQPSRVMRRLPARHRLVFTYDRQWRGWRHADFRRASAVLRWATNALLLALYPLVALYLLSKPSRPLLQPAPVSADLREGLQ